MAFLERNTLWRDPRNCALWAWVRARKAQVLAAMKTRKHPHVGALNDRQLRDIGLHTSDVEAFRHRLPSQHTHHPRG